MRHPYYVRRAIVMLLMIAHAAAWAQIRKKIRVQEKTFQFSLFPGIGTNGISSASYYNKYSFNLFGGLSAGNHYLELGLLTNSNMRSTTGIQIAGLANIIGTNSFVNLSLSEERELISEDFDSSNKGIQISGLLNYVLDQSSSLQITGGLNVVGRDFQGIQIAGIGNSSGGTMFGLQVAGIYNLVNESVGGFQISSLFNYTDAQLSGMQIALINKARFIKGKKSTPPVRERGMQIGLFNFSKEMDGVQIGLINFSGELRGKQVGLINFFDRMGSKELTRMGTPIGLLNFGTRGSALRVSFNELFPINVEYTTGNCLNCSWVIGSEMPFYDDNQIFNQNALIYAFDRWQGTWGFGYGFQKNLYNKFMIRPHPSNARRVIVYGVKFIHLNRSSGLDTSFNILNKFHVEYGKRYKGMYAFIGVAVNYFVFQKGVEGYQYMINSVVVNSGDVFGLGSNFSPGYTFGVQLL